MTQPTHFDFDDDPGDEPGEELPPACTFTLGGKEWTVRNADLVPYALMQRLLLSDKVGVTVQAGPFFAAVLQPDQVEAFMAVLAEPQVTVAKVENVIRHVVAALYGRPTTPPATSPAGRKPTGRKSAGGSSSRGTRPRASAG